MSDQAWDTNIMSHKLAWIKQLFSLVSPNRPKKPPHLLKELWIPETASVLVFDLQNVPKHLRLSEKDTVCQQSHAVYVSVVLNYYSPNNVTFSAMWKKNDNRWQMSLFLTVWRAIHISRTWHKCTSGVTLWKNRLQPVVLLFYNCTLKKGMHNLKYLWVLFYWATDRLQ